MGIPSPILKTFKYFLVVGTLDMMDYKKNNCRRLVLSADQKGIGTRNKFGGQARFWCPDRESLFFS